MFGFCAHKTRKLVTYVCLSAFGGRDPMTRGPRRIVPDVLLVPTFKLSNPIQILVLVETNNLSRLALRLALWFHDFWLENSILLLLRAAQ